MEHDHIYAALARQGLIGADERPSLEALTGGVSSEIYRLRLEGGDFCVKRALPRLKVAQEWLAPVERADFEVAWIRVVQAFAPEHVPQVIASDARDHLFVMPYLPPEKNPVWKRELLEGRAGREFASQVGQLLGRIHARTAGDATLASQFDNDHIFDPIRVDPYLRATARAHPECAAPLLELARRTLATKLVLVHGDVSPKNILVGPGGPVFLDAETAWFGDPAFDLAFCLNHLLLKCIWRPESTAQYLDCFDALRSSYLDRVSWEPRSELVTRAATLLGAFLLARIDGKSPVEYITKEEDRERVRGVAIPLISEQGGELDEVRARWAIAVGV